jgi:hypothetical protein
MYFRQKINSLTLSGVIITAIIWLMGITDCARKKQSDPEARVVAKIGHSEISVRDFRLDYEFGFSHLKGGQDRKLTYLDKMIDERLLSLQGYEMGLDKSEHVQTLVKNLEKELVIEQVFKDNVNSKIEISHEEIRDAINKSKVSWKLRYWVEPNLEHAGSVCAYMRKHGYAETVSKILSSNPEINLKPGDFETSYVTLLDVSQELFEAIKNLELGEISDPVTMGEGYYIFQVVDIRREPVTEYEYQSRADSYKKILRVRKEQELEDKFISAFMTPKKVVTKRDVFAALSQNLYQWYKRNKKNEYLREEIEKSDDSDPYLAQIRRNLDKVLVTYDGGEWTVDEFLKTFNPKSIKMNENEDLGSYRSKLNDQIASAICDYFLLQKGYKEKVNKRSEVKAEIKRWTDKWVYQELRHQLTSNITIKDEEAKVYFDKFNDLFKQSPDDNPSFENNIKIAKLYAGHQKELALLSSELRNLRARYGVTVNQAVLDSIATVDFSKSRWASLQVFKRNSMRMAYPVVDPTWGF